MTKPTQLSRRTVLRGLGTALTLPWMEGFLPTLSAATSTAAGAAPLRMAFLYVPNGVHMPDFTPSEEGRLGSKLPYLLEPLAPVKDKLLVLSGLAHDKARANGDGAGDHARSAAVFLTGCQPRKTSGADIKAGVSVDQIAAAEVGRQTRLPSLEIGCDRGQQAGSCDSGYSCAYSSNISWKTENTPMAKEIIPRLVFERMFGDTSGDDAAASERQAYRRSVLDFVLDDARRLSGRLNGADRGKLDGYLTSVREVEQQIERAEARAAEETADIPELDLPESMPSDYTTHVRLMYDLLTLALQADVTRVSTFLIANEGSNRSYPWLGVSDGHHSLSHHGNDQAKLNKIRTINRFHTEELGRFVAKLASIKEGAGSLLDHSMIVYGSCIGDGNRHNHDELPYLVVGGGNGSLAGGRHLKYPKGTPAMNMYLALLDRMGVAAEHAGDSTGRLEGLEG